MVVSALVERIEGGSEAGLLFILGLVVGLPGWILWLRTRPPARIPTATIFAAALFGCIAFVLAASVPYIASGLLTRFELALFEAVAGLTTTSSTVVLSIEGASAGMQFFRATTQWIGGITFVVFAVSVLPFLGVGGMELVRSSAPGPAAERLAQRMRGTAARLVPVYAGFTAVVAIGYVVLGMSLHDGITHAFTTASTGGFSNYDRSFAHFDSAGLEWFAIVTMVVAGGSLALYWQALRGKPLVLLRSAEFRAYITIAVLLCAAALAWNGADHGFDTDTVRHTIFTTVSLTSTTGYRMLDFDQWAAAVQLLFVFTVGLGGMAGSAAGGFKVFRLLAVLGYARRQLFSQLHPKAVTVIRFGRDIVPNVVVTRIVGFFGLFMAAGGAATFLLAAFGADVRTSISAVASGIGNVGPGLGDVGPMRQFAYLDSGTRGVLMVVMLLGRLEVYPLLLGVVPFARFVSDRLPRGVGKTVVRVVRG